MNDLESQLRLEALNTAAKLAMSSSLGVGTVVTTAREYYNFLSGDAVQVPREEAETIVRRILADLSVKQQSNIHSF